MICYMYILWNEPQGDGRLHGSLTAEYKENLTSNPARGDSGCAWFSSVYAPAEAGKSSASWKWLSTYQNLQVGLSLLFGINSAAGPYETNTLAHFQNLSWGSLGIHSPPAWTNDLCNIFTFLLKCFMILEALNHKKKKRAYFWILKRWWQTSLVLFPMEDDLPVSFLDTIWRVAQNIIICIIYNLLHHLLSLEGF